MIALWILLISYLSFSGHCTSSASDSLHSPLPRFSWHLPLLGQSVHSYFIQSQDSEANEWIVSASVQNVLGILDPSTSELKWRFVFPQNESYLSSTVCGEILITLSNSAIFGSTLKLFSVQSGTLFTVYQIPKPLHESKKNPLFLCLSAHAFGLLTHHAFYQFGISQEPTLWHDSSHQLLDIHWNSNKLWALSHLKNELFLLYSAPKDPVVVQRLTKFPEPLYFAGMTFSELGPKHLVLYAASKFQLFTIKKDFALQATSFSLPKTANFPIQTIQLFSSLLKIDFATTSSLYDLQDNLSVEIFQGERIVDVASDSISDTSIFLLFPKNILRLSKSEKKLKPLPQSFQLTELNYNQMTIAKRTRKMFLSTLEGHLYLWEGDKLEWTRFESMASPKSALVLDFPTPRMWEEEEEKVTNLFQRLLDRWRLHWQQLKSIDFFHFKSKSHFGFSKLILILTQNHLLYALESSQLGKVKWWKKLPTDIHSMKLYQPTKGSEAAIVLLQGSQNMLYLQPFTGEITQSTQTPLKNSAEILKDSTSSSASTTSSTISTYTYSLASNGTLTGYSKNTASNTLTQLYSIRFEEPILKTVKTEFSQRVASQGRILFADRSVIYKYLNPHLLTLLTGRNTTLKLYSIDTVSGRLLFNFKVENVDLDFPVHLVSVEHWTVLLFVDLHSGWIATAIDFFEPGRPESSFSSFTSETPVSRMASFVLPLRDRITGMGVTRTRNNIAIRDLIYTTDREVGSISRKLLDGLRDIAHPPENEIVPYEPVLSLDDRQTLSKGLLVKSNHILTCPTELESTSMVFTYGHDLFWTSVTPSGSFDKLSAHFPKLTLLATCLTLAVSAIVARAMLRRKQLQVQWY